LHVYVEDTDAVFTESFEGRSDVDRRAAGSRIRRARRRREGSIGNYWYIATHKGEDYIPKGLHNVNVYMHPLRAEPVIGFLKRAFGAQELAKYASPDGVVHHAEIRVGDAVVEMARPTDRTCPCSRVSMLYVPDCDAVYKRALAAGRSRSRNPQTIRTETGAAGLPTRSGITWYIATHIKDVS